MAFVIADRVRETTTTTGTGSVTLAGAYTSFQSFSAAIGNGNSTYYTISNPTTNEWEVGIGTYTSGTNSLSRTTVLASSNAGSLVSFSAGTKDVFVTQPAERSLLVQSAGSGLFAGNAAFTANGLLYANATTTVTTGSALTYNGTGLGVGVASSLGILQVRTQTNANMLWQNSTFGSGGVLLNVINDAGSANATLDFQATSFQFAISGSEQMRLTSTGLGIGTSSPTQVLTIAKSDNFPFIHWNNSSNTNIAFAGWHGGTGGSDDFRIGTTGAKPLTLQTNNTERARIDSSGNLGIGTSSPSGRITVSTNGSGGVNVNESTNATATYGYLTVSHYTNGAFISTVAGSNAGADILRFGTGNTERMRLDSSGNLGLGVTPSAWSGKAFEVGSKGNGIWNLNQQNSSFLCNAYYDGAYKYGGTGSATSYQQAAGVHYWYTAASGTAGNAITFTQAMTLDASGNLGVGTTTPLAKLDVNGTSLLRNTQYTYQPTPTSLTGAQTLTAAQLLTGILINTAGTGNWTMPTGTAIETGVFASLPVNSAIRFVVISTGGGGPTIATNTGVTLVGVMNVATASSATFILRKTATNTYTLYRA